LKFIECNRENYDCAEFAGALTATGGARKSTAAIASAIANLVFIVPPSDDVSARHDDPLAGVQADESYLYQ